jgi:signal-transduction protein with cAMP-binding, CBS, and nucleotidyltransferase domain
MLGIRLSDPVGSLVDAAVATIRSTATLREAASALAADAVGLLVVVGPRGVDGVLSERDLVTALADEVDIDQARVRDHASSELVSVEEDATIVDAAAAMAAAEVRHLAITRQGEVVGVVSIRDVVHVLLEQPDLTTQG